jgi:hypothetical protein
VTELLQRALAEVEKLPADAQDAVATRILADLADKQAWAERFEATSAEQWNRLAEMARQEIAAGDTIPLEEAFLALLIPIEGSESARRAWELVETGAASWSGGKPRGIAPEAEGPWQECLGHRSGIPSLILYLDTSSLVKLYVEEDGSPEVERLAIEASLVCTSVIAYAEARSAFAQQLVLYPDPPCPS